MEDIGPIIGSKYKIQDGDTITEIAFLAYGDARRYVELAMHNASVPGFKPTSLQPGLEIDIPQPDYLPMPRGVGGMRGSIGKSFSVRPVERAIDVTGPGTERNVDRGGRR